MMLTYTEYHMQRFKSFISESADPAAAFERARAISIYLTGPRKERFEQALDVMIKGANDKQIYNAPFTDAYSYGLSRGVEAAWEKCRDEVWESLRDKIGEGYWDTYSFSNLNGLKKFEKAWTPYKNDAPKQWAFIEAIRDLPDAIKTLKTYIVKGKPPKEPAPGAFMKPMASLDANKKAIDFLNDAVKSFKVDFHNSVRDQFFGDLDKVRKLSTPEELKAAAANVRSMAAQVGEIVYVGGKKAFVVKSDANEIVKNLVDRTVNDIVEHFVAKNTSKLALIFQKKAEVKSHKILRTSIRNNTIENSMYFEFNDNSSFVIQSQVVYKFTNLGKPFMQFPTRFSDVTMADGTKMKMPSEEKMIKEF